MSIRLTPSKRRRMGRHAFYPEGDPNEENPYLKSNAWGADMFARDWRDGWEEAREAHEQEQKEQNETLYCETCGERPAVVITGEVSFCTDCAAAEIDSMASVMCKISDLLE